MIIVIFVQFQKESVAVFFSFFGKLEIAVLYDSVFVDGFQERELLQDYNNNFFLLSLNGATITIKHVIFVLFKWRQSVASGGLFCFRTALKFRRRCALC